MSNMWIYKGKQVELLAITHVWAGEQYCTILMENRMGGKQRQSVLLRHLTNVPQPASDHAAEEVEETKPRVWNRFTRAYEPEDMVLCGQPNPTSSRPPELAGLWDAANDEPVAVTPAAADDLR